jgi:hypothetical protein
MPAYTLNRTQVMTEYFQMIKHRKIIFPRWDDWQPYAEDIKNINIEYDEVRNNMKYTNDDADDIFHALIYASETARMHTYSISEVY